MDTIQRSDLETVTGGFDIGGIASTIGGLIDKYAGTGGKATEIAKQVGGIAQQFTGGGGSSGGAGATGGE